MKYLFSISTTLLLTLLLSSPALARSTVKIENTVNGESSTLEVESNDSDSSNINVNQHNNETKIRLEENGEVRTFEANGDEDVSWQSDDGSARVMINQSGSAKIMQTDKDSTSNTDEEDKNKETASDSGEESKEENTNETGETETEISSFTSLFQAIQDFFTSFFS